MGGRKLHPPGNPTHANKGRRVGNRILTPIILLVSVFSEPQQQNDREISDPLDCRLVCGPSSPGQAYARTGDDGHCKGDDPSG